MKKIKFLFITLVLIFTLNGIGTCIIAAENESEEVQEEQAISEEEIEKQKQEILSSINEYLEEISSQINEIDVKIENTKKQEEFEYYPAIRLNIDTPMFGMTSLVENKLRIKKDVSTADVANKYSIRDVVKNRTIRLPESYLASIVMGTKEIAIDENMTLSELKLTLVKCIQYKSQVKSVEEFIDSQINKTFKDYIAQEKKDNIKDIKDRTVKVKKNLVEISDKIYEMTFLGIDTTDYITQYNEISEELYNISKKSKDTLMQSSELTELMKQSLNNESTVLDMKTKVDEAYEKAVLNMNYLETLQRFNDMYEAKIDKIDKYVKAATTEKKQIVDEVEQIVTIKNYNVTSESIIDYIENLNENIDEEIELYTQSLEDESNSDENVVEKEEISKEELYKSNKEKIDNLYYKYKEMLNREYNFYTNNINMLLKDSNTKMTSIIGQIDSGITIDNEIFTYTKYIYINLPENLSNYLDKSNLDSVIELNTLINELNTELNTLTKTNMNIKKMYDKMSEDLLKS